MMEIAEILIWMWGGAAVFAVVFMFIQWISQRKSIERIRRGGKP